MCQAQPPSQPSPPSRGPRTVTARRLWIPLLLVTPPRDSENDPPRATRNGNQDKAPHKRCRRAQRVEPCPRGQPGRPGKGLATDPALTPPRPYPQRRCWPQAAAATETPAPGQEGWPLRVLILSDFPLKDPQGRGQSGAEAGWEPSAGCTARGWRAPGTPTGPDLEERPGAGGRGRPGKGGRACCAGGEGVESSRGIWGAGRGGARGARHGCGREGRRVPSAQPV